MAKTYLDIQNSAYKVGNIMDWTNALTRLSGVPVDITEVYNSYNAAVEYAATNPVAYEGQIITVTENGITTVYVITPENLGTVEVTRTVGEGDEAVEETVSYEVHIKEVGTKPAAANASIFVDDDGNISIAGFEDAADAYLPRVKVVKGENDEDVKTLDWVPISAIINDTNTKTKVRVAEDSALTITSDEDAYDASTDTYTYTLDVNIPDIPEYSVTKDERSEGATSTTYHVTKDNVSVGEAIVVPDAYNDQPLAARVSSLENTVDGATNANSHEKRLEKIEAFFNSAAEDKFGEDGQKLDNALDTLVELQNYVDTHGQEAAGMLEAIEDLEGAVGHDTIPASGEEGQEGYKPAEEATGLFAEIDAVAGIASGAAADIAAATLRVADLESVAKSYLAKDESGKPVEDAIKTAIDAAAEKGQKGIDNAKKAQDAADKAQQEIDALELVVGKAAKDAVGEEGQDGYEPAEDATGIIADIASVTSLANQTAANYAALVEEDTGRIPVAEDKIAALETLTNINESGKTIRDDVTALQALTGDNVTGNNALHTELDRVAKLVGEESKPGQGTPGDDGYVAPVAGKGLIGDVEAVTATANAANALAVNHDSRIGTIESNYVRIGEDNKLYGGKNGTEVLIFDCGNSGYIPAEEPEA